MEKKYSIGLTVALILFVVLMMFIDKTGYEYMEEQSRAKAENNTVITQGNASKEEIYYLAELNGYVAVYYEDKNTVFEYTNILLEDLPEKLQEEIKNWKQLEGSESVYGFLENYSS